MGKMKKTLGIEDGGNQQNLRFSTIEILTLLATPGIGRRTVEHIMGAAKYSPSGIGDLMDLIIETKKGHPRVKVPVEKDLEVARDQALMTVDNVERLGIKMTQVDDENYPERLRLISSPPLVLFTWGNMDCIQNPAVAIVGTREPGKFGEESARRIASVFSENGFTVVSGLALGCDTAAHRGCLDAGGQTVAVLAHGLDTVYPLKNQSLAEEIFEQSGCLMSEYPPGVKVRNNHFVERDRIQSGLSDAVLVAETSLDGGTMHTVGFCLEQDRVLACLVHPKENRDSVSTAGNKKLLGESTTVSLEVREDLEDLILRLKKPRPLKISTVPDGDDSPQDQSNMQMGFGW